MRAPPLCSGWASRTWALGSIARPPDERTASKLGAANSPPPDSGAPASLVVTGEEIRESISEVVHSIIAGIRHALENTPPELSGDIMTTGIALAGGGALLKGLDKRISEELKVNVSLGDDPLAAVVKGAGICLDNLELYKDLLF